MKILGSVLLVLLTAGFISADCKLRDRSVYRTQLYYYNGGQYHQYTGGNHGTLYYQSGGHYVERETIVLVPKAIQVEVQRDHYYSINQAARDDLLADAIVGRLLRLQGQQVDRKVVIPDKSGVGPVGPTPKGRDLGDDRAGTYQEPIMVKIIGDSCAKCHGASSKYTKFQTADGKLTDVPAGKVWEAFGLVNSGEMPKGGKSLDDESVKAFYAWAKNARKE